MRGRIRNLAPGELDEAQRALYDSLVANEVAWAEGAGVRAIAPDGTLLGPFNPLLFSPALGTAQVGVFRADKAGTALSRRVHEVVVLTVGAAWRSDYELYAHSAVAKVAGLSDAVIRAIASGQTPILESEGEAIAHAFSSQLVHEHRVDQNTYANAARTFGDKGVVDMVMLIGLYLTTCAIINAFEIPTPESVTP
jgi:4-carboxymuconolactone decarboxylase